MKTINLKEESPSVAQLLAMARKKSVLLVSNDGATFVLEEADEFDREVAELGGSEKFHGLQPWLHSFAAPRLKSGLWRHPYEFVRRTLWRMLLTPHLPHCRVCNIIT